MKIVAALAGLAAFAFALGAAAQVQDWGDANDALSGSPEFDSSKALCRELRDHEPPAADRPTPAQARALQGCNAEELYYGIGRPADPVRARQCAFLEAEQEEAVGAVFSGRALLMTIYANGVGARRDLDVAIHLACQIDGAPAESHGRITHLNELRRRHWAGSDFGYCDDITSGLSMGYCADHDAAIADARREARLAELVNHWSPRERQVFAPLRAALDAYVDARGEGEVDLSGTGRNAFITGAQQALRNEFMTMLQRLEAGRAPIMSRERFQADDAALNDTYRRVMRGPFDPACAGCVTRDGIQGAQRAWLRYRDAFVAFAALKYPRVSRDSLAAWLTEQRTQLLRQRSE